MAAKKKTAEAKSAKTRKPAATRASAEKKPAKKKAPGVAASGNKSTSGKSSIPRTKTTETTPARKAATASTAAKEVEAKAKAKPNAKAADSTTTKKKASVSTAAVKEKSTKRTAASPAGKEASAAAATNAKIKDSSTKPSKTDKRKTVPKSTARQIDYSDNQPLLSQGPIHGIAPYQLSAGEEYMSEGQLAHFRNILLNWKRELMEEVDRTIHHLRDEATNFPDPNDRATQESEFGLELRARDRERKLLKKIDSALERIDDGSYGYCEETGEEIGLRRLEARPIATLCLEAQERHEMVERHYGERDDRYR